MSKKTLIISVVVAVAAAAAGAYFFILEKPEVVLYKMLKSISEVESLAFSGTMNVKLDKDSLSEEEIKNLQESIFGEEEAFDISFDGAMDFSEKSDPQAEANIGLLSSGEDVLGGEIRVTGNNLYVGLSKTPDIPQFAAIGQVLTSTWVRADISKVVEEFSKEKESFLTEEEKKELEKSMAESNPVLITEVLSDEEIGGINCYHYKYETDKENFKKILIEFLEKQRDEALTEEQLEGLDDMQAGSGEIWIGKGDYLPYKWVSESESSDPSAKIISTFFFEKFNEKVSVDPPAESISIEELLGAIMLQAYQSSFGGELNVSPAAGMQGL